MSLVWSRALGPRSCGSCGNRIPAGAAALTIVLKTTTKIRCATCAAIDVPADIPPPPAKTPVQLGPWPGYPPEREP